MQTVYLVDDDESVANSLKWLLEPLGYDVLVFSNGQLFLDEAKNINQNKASCVILDIRMTVMGGIELQAALRKQEFRLPIIYLSGHGDIPQAVSAIKNGAYDFAQKPINDQDLIDKINAAIRDFKTNKLESEVDSMEKNRVDSLTNREREIVALVSEGKSSKEMARTLNISYKTIEVHRS